MTEGFENIELSEGGQKYEIRRTGKGPGGGVEFVPRAVNDKLRTIDVDGIPTHSHVFGTDPHVEALAHIYDEGKKTRIQQAAQEAVTRRLAADDDFLESHGR